MAGGLGFYPSHLSIKVGKCNSSNAVTVTFPKYHIVSNANALLSLRLFV